VTIQTKQSKQDKTTKTNMTTLIAREILHPELDQRPTNFFSFPHLPPFNVLGTTGAKRDHMADQYNDVGRHIKFDAIANRNHYPHHYKRINPNTHRIVTGDVIKRIADRSRHMIRPVKSRNLGKYNKFEKAFERFMPRVEITLILLKELTTDCRVISWLEPSEDEPQTFLPGRRIVKFLEVCLSVLRVTMERAVRKSSSKFNNQRVIDELNECENTIALLIRKLNLEPIIRNVHSEQIFHILASEQRFDETKVSPNVRRVMQSSDLNRYMLEFI
jgi:hypothetical protein